MQRRQFWDNILAMNMFDFLEATPVEINQGIAARVRAVRKRRKISQIKLSEKSGLGFFVNSAIVIFLCLSYNISSKGGRWYVK